LCRVLDHTADKRLQLSTTTEISFCASSPQYFAQEEELEIFVNVRNVKTLTIQLYEVRTIDYYTRKRQEIQGDINLEGLLPNEQHEMDLSYLSPWQQARIPVKVSSTTAGRLHRSV
jgi:hypothetical protein